jgi:hypothetical protein
MRKLTKQSLDELARTMRVIPESDLNNYVGAYANDCFWRCVAYANGAGNSEAAAASYAEAYWISQVGYYTAMNYLSEHGGEMSTSEVNNYKAYNAGSLSLANICLQDFGDGNAHAVVYTGQAQVTIAGYTYTEYYYYDPQSNTSITSVKELKKFKLHQHEQISVIDTYWCAI